jgi:PKD repeat protein
MTKSTFVLLILLFLTVPASAQVMVETWYWDTTLTPPAWHPMPLGGQTNPAYCWLSYWLMDTCHTDTIQYIDWQISGTQREWWVREPGIYVANGLTFQVRSDSDVVIDYEGFESLHPDSVGVDSLIRVWYAFSLSGSVVPGDADWMSAESLNAIDDTLWDSPDLHKGLAWKLWNKIEVKRSYSPCHDYSDSARVYLRTYGTCDESYPFSVKVRYYPLNADFVGSPTSGSSPLQVDFIDLSTCNPTSWYWDFGDNSTSSQQNPTHVYNDTGFFDVRLIASNELYPGYPEYSDVDNIIKPDYIYVSGLPLTANFSAAPEVGPAPLDVQFTDQSAGNPTHWHWDFGDGHTDTVQNPIRTYIDTGYFDVKLVVSDSIYTDSLMKYNYIQVFPHVCHIIHVPTDYSTIQEAIDVAWDCDTVLVARGHYYERINFSGKGILVASNFIFDNDTTTIDSTIIDADTSVLGISDLGSVVTFASNEDSNSEISGFTLKNGVSWWGGGIYCMEGSPTITGNIITGNSADSGGGILCYGGSPTISNNLFTYNSARYLGGGVYYYCYDESSPTIVNNTISDNSASVAGGGIYCVFSSLTISNNIIANNLDGGGIYCEYGSYPKYIVILYNGVWNNADGNFSGCPQGVGDTTWGTNINGTPCDSFYNIIRDPQFCEPDSDNYYLFNTSPCLGAGEGGADIGAFGIGCYKYVVIPLLSWTGEAGYETDGVSPDTGLNETLFQFRIIYTDSNNIPPASGYPKVNIDINGDGDFNDENEGNFAMGPADADTVYSDGKIYYYNTTLPVTSTCQYSFSAQNNLGQTAIGEPTNLKSGPVILDTTVALDLYIHASDITFSESNPDEGETFTVSAMVHNNSDSNLSDVSVSFYDGENPLDQKVIPYIPSRGSSQCSTEVSFSTMGFYPIKVVVDEENSFDEWNESNNWAIRPIKIGDYPVEGDIIVDASINSPVYTGTWINITGNARYYPIEWEKVCGARVTATIQETGQQYTTYTNNLGNFNCGFWGPDSAGTYNIEVEVTDFTLAGYDTVTLVVISQDKPDLIVDVSVSGEFKIGKTLTVTTRVSNIGGGPAYDFTTRLFKDGSYFYDEEKSSLLSGESFWFSPQIISFDEVGTHCVKAITDVEDTVQEFNEANNQDYMCFYVADTIADLKVDYYDVSVSNTTPNNGDTIRILAEVHNLDGPVLYNVPVRFYKDSVPFGGDVIIPQIQPGQSQQVVSTITWIVDFNKHLVEVMADPDNMFTEANESNNRGALPLPYDLYSYYRSKCPSCWPYYWPYFFSKASSFVDQPVTIYGSVRNRGGFDLLGEVNIQISDDLEGVLGVITVDSLMNHNQNYSADSIVHSFTQIGTHTLTATVDYDNQYDEWNEGADNIHSATIFVDSLRPDLMIHSDHIRPTEITPDSGDTVDIYADIYNIGQITAESIWVQFLMDDIQLGERVCIDSIPTGTENYPTIHATEPWIATCEPPNLHVCKVIIDPDSLIKELDESNNVATKSIIACGAPDLVVETIFLCKRDLLNIDTIYAVIQNRGKYSATAQVSFSYYDRSNISRPMGFDTITVPELGGIDTAVVLWYGVLDSTQICVKIRNTDPPESDTTNNDSCTLFRSFKRGDVNCDASINLADVIYLANYILKGGASPCPVVEAGDIDYDGQVNLVDVIFLANYILKGGPGPCNSAIRRCEL